MKGVFRQAASQPHVELRRRLLTQRSLPAPPYARTGNAADVDELGKTVLAEIDEHGAAVIQLDRPLENEEFLALGALLGTPQPELAPTVQPHVENEVILNLVTSSPATSDPDLQPFGANWLSLHSESSGAPAAVQPRFITLMCVTPGDRAGCAETVLVPMRSVFEALSADDRALLANVRYDRGDPPTIMRYEAGRAIFSIRDFQEDPLAWVHDGAPVSPEAIEATLTRLYEAMYGTVSYGVRWSRGLLVVIDNTVHFHGRTGGIAAGPGAARHLKRLRIRDHVAVA